MLSNLLFDNEKGLLCKLQFVFTKHRFESQFKIEQGSPTMIYRNAMGLSLLPGNLKSSIHIEFGIIG